MVRPNGCLDVSISSLLDSQGLLQWSIHLYKSEETPCDPMKVASVPDWWPETEPLDRRVWPEGRNDHLITTIWTHIYPQVRVYKAIGRQGDFRKHLTVNHNALTDTDKYERVAVTDHLRDWELTYLDIELLDVPVDNTDPDYNNQQWVLDALALMHDRGFYTEDVFNSTYAILLQLREGVEPEDLILGDMQDGYSSWEDESDDDPES